MKRTLLLVIGAVIILSGAGYFYLGNSAASETVIDEEGLYEVQRGDLRITVTENGSLLAKDSRKVTYKARYSSKLTKIVEEGKRVQEGDELARFDTKDLANRKEQTELEIVQEEARLKTARSAVEIQKADNEAAQEKAEIAIEKANNELERYRDGDVPQQRRKHAITIKDAETTFGRKQKKYNDSKRLFDKKYIKKTELEDHRLEFEKAEVSLDGARLDLELFNKYTLPMTMKEKTTAVKNAERSLAAAKHQAESRNRQKAVAVTQHEKRLKTQRQRLERINKDLDQMILKAPCPGIVIYGNPRESWSREQVKIGNSIWGGFTLFTIPDLRVMQVKLAIHEADITKIKNDMTAKITMDSYPGVLLNGKVVKIASIANRASQRDGAVKKFDVYITIEDELEITLKPGISAKAEIHIADRTDVIFVPLQAVFSQDGKTYCHLAVDGTEIEKREIETGMSNAHHVEVIKGLELGEKVLLYNPLMGKGELDSEKEEEPSPESPADDEGSGQAPGKNK